MNRDLVFCREYDYPPASVWQALTDAQALSEWMMPNDFKPVVGHKFQFRTNPKPGFDGVTHCKVIEVDPPKTLAYTFTGGGLDTLVRFRLQATATGTILHIAHTGFSGVRAVLISYLMQMGISVMYDKQLPAVLKKLCA
jgi:uncharacterized protein YndB with AHSA1/START domain